MTLLEAALSAPPPCVWPIHHATEQAARADWRGRTAETRSVMAVGRCSCGGWVVRRPDQLER